MVENEREQEVSARSWRKNGMAIRALPRFIWLSAPFFLNASHDEKRDLRRDFAFIPLEKCSWLLFRSEKGIRKISNISWPLFHYSFPYHLQEVIRFLVWFLPGEAQVLNLSCSSPSLFFAFRQNLCLLEPNHMFQFFSVQNKISF